MIHSVGEVANFLEFCPSRYITFLGAVPWSPIFLPATSPLVIDGSILSTFLILRGVHAHQVARWDELLQAESTRCRPDRTSSAA